MKLLCTHAWLYILCVILYVLFHLGGRARSVLDKFRQKVASRVPIREFAPFFPHAFPFLRVPLPYASALFHFPFLSVCLIMYFHARTHTQRDTIGFPFHAMTEEQMLRPGFPCSALISNLCSRNLNVHGSRATGSRRSPAHDHGGRGNPTDEG